MHFSGDTGPPLSFRCPDQYSSANITRLEAPSLPNPAAAGTAARAFFVRSSRLSSKRGFARLLATPAPVAQLDRVPDYGSGGWEFESLRARQ